MCRCLPNCYLAGWPKEALWSPFSPSSLSVSKPATTTRVVGECRLIWDRDSFLVSANQGLILHKNGYHRVLPPPPPFSLLKSFSSSPHTIQINRKRDSDTLDKEARLLLDPSQVENMIVGCLY